MHPRDLPRLLSVESPGVCLGAWESMRKREEDCAPLPSYLKLHPELSPSMRAILIDWLMEVCQEYLLKRETFHLAVTYVDRFLSKTQNVMKAQLQLVGICALYIASKLEVRMRDPRARARGVADSGSNRLPPAGARARLPAPASRRRSTPPRPRSSWPLAMARTH